MRKPNDAPFRFPRAVPRDPAVELWFDNAPDPLAIVARAWFERIRACGPGVRELIHDKCPVACVEDAAFAYVKIFKTHVNLGFFRGACLPDPAGLLEGGGKRMLHVKLRFGEPIDEPALTHLITDAYADMRARFERV